MYVYCIGGICISTLQPGANNNNIYWERLIPHYKSPVNECISRNFSINMVNGYYFHIEIGGMGGKNKYEMGRMGGKKGL